MTTTNAAAIVAISGFVAAASADILYTTVPNTANGTVRLATLDTETHNIGFVGQLNYDAPGNLMELAYHNGLIYGIDHTWGVGTRLLAIDPANANVVSVVPLTLDGSGLNRPAALASSGGELFISYAGPGSSSVSLHNTIARLSANGEITDAIDYRAVAADIGLRSLATAPDGRLLTMEHTFTDYLYYGLLGRDPATYDLLREGGAQPFFNAIEVSGGLAYVLDDVTGYVEVFNAATGASAGSWSYNNPQFHTLIGLAAIPAPGTALIVLAAAAGAARRRR